MKGAAARVFALCMVLLLVQDAHCSSLFKVFCNGTPLFRGRADNIVSPGAVSGHIHKVAGGSNFGIGSASLTPIQVFNDMRASPCTSCSIASVDLSAYWHPDLFYKWPNGTLSLVPDGGLTIYYLTRSGSDAQANPSFTAFPPGFRMLAGNPFRRSYNASSVADRAISYACLSYDGNGGPETPGFPTANHFCKDGLRMQVHFPQCWDGINVDSPTHTTHVAYPIERPDGGNCPNTHPIRLPNLFFEAFYSVSKFPHGTGTQPFVLAPGDATGYGFHGDFLNGWDQQVLQAALRDATCDATNTNNGNSVQNCAPLASYLQDTVAGKCTVNRPIHLTEYLGLGVPTMTTLPGCNPITYGPASPIPCSAPPTATFKASPTQRFHLKAVSTGKYVTSPSEFNKYPLAATVVAADLTYKEVFNTVPQNGLFVALTVETNAQFISASGDNGQLWANRGSPSGWEVFTIVAQANNQVAILSNRNAKFVSLQSDNTLAPTAALVGTKELFVLEIPSGGGI